MKKRQKPAKVFIYSILFEGLIDKIGAASSRRIAEEKVRKYLDWTTPGELAMDFWHLVMEARDAVNLEVLIDEYEVDGEAVTPPE